MLQSYFISKNKAKFFSEDDKRSGYEVGNTIVWPTLVVMEEYLQSLRDGHCDRPFECRWDHFVVEKVYFGPYSMNEVIGWWKAKQLPHPAKGYDLTPLDKCPLYDDPNVHNFTISS